MIIELKSANIYDPHNKIFNKRKNLLIKDGKIINTLINNEKITKTIKVHFNFSLKDKNFWDGPSTSGRLFKIVFQRDILGYLQGLHINLYPKVTSPPPLFIFSTAFFEA